MPSWLSWLDRGSYKPKAVGQSPTEDIYGFWVMEIRGHNLSQGSCTANPLDISPVEHNLPNKTCTELRVGTTPRGARESIAAFSDWDRLWAVTPQ